MMDNYRPDSVTPPGDTLREMLEERGWSSYDFSVRAVLSYAQVFAVLNDRCEMTAWLAARLEDALGAPASFWIARATTYRASLEEQGEGE